MPSTHPITLVIVDNEQVTKGSLRTYLEARHILILASDDEIEGMQLPDTTVVSRSGFLFLYDPADTTSAHAPPDTLVDGSTPGRRYKRIVTSSSVSSPRLVTAAGDITAGDTDRLILIDKAVPEPTEVQLGAAADRDNAPLIIKDYGGVAETHNITITPAPGETIDGEASIVLASNWESAGLQPVSGGWART